jgi:RecJ-like exonuclease
MQTASTELTGEAFVESWVLRCVGQAYCPKVMMAHDDIPAFNETLERVVQRLDGHQVPCAICRGDGFLWDDGATCLHCGGTGDVAFVASEFTHRGE